MDSKDETHSRLSKIETLWSVVRRSHDDEEAVARTAQQQLLQRYSGAIRRYLVTSLRDENLAEDLLQEFALKFVSGEFKNVDPHKGRFRYFVKTVVRNLINQHHRKKSVRKEQRLVPDLPADMGTDSSQDDLIFRQSWRDDLLEQTWQALADHEGETGVNYYAVLRLRVSEPQLKSDEFAQCLGEKLKKEISSGTARVTLHRAREKFANLMISLVSSSLQNPDRESIESELIELGLIDYCRDSLQSSS